MNRSEYETMLQDVMHELSLPGGPLAARLEHEPGCREQAEFIATVALTVVDRFHAYLTRRDFEMREADEHS